MDKLKKILDDHKHWLNEDCDGWEDMRANLYEANLYEADLHGANLRGALNVPFIPMHCPDTGAFIGWKKVATDNGERIAKLQIPAKARRSSATTTKCRASAVKVLEIQTTDGEKVDEIWKPYTFLNSDIVYEAGKTVKADSWDDDRWNECSHGIHFFINRQEAVNWR